MQATLLAMKPKLATSGLTKMNHYEAKFLREAKENPTEWIIAPNGRGGCTLVHIGPAPKHPSGTYTVPVLKLVVNND